MAEHQSSDAHSDDHNHDGMGKYLAVFGALLVLTAISFGVANSPLMDTPSIGWLAMITISCAKASLVILFFMHLKWEANWKYVLTIPASIMSVFLMVMLVPDVGMRTRKYSEERWLYAADPTGSHYVSDPLETIDEDEVTDKDSHPDHQ